MSKPQKPTWAYGDPSYTITPSAGKQAIGWLPGEKPPYQYMNWIHLKSGEWLTYLENKTETISPTMVRSNSTLSWNGSTITYTQPIDISFRVTTGEQINRIGVSASPITLLDGQVLVFIKDKTNASPVTLAAGTYSSLIAGQYAILNESTLTAVNQENEIILFRRRGSNLEIPINGLVYPSGSTISLGQSFTPAIDVSSSGVVPPIGSIIAFYDFNGLLTFNPSNWTYCDGRTATFGGGIAGPAVTPDLSNRYLVGFGTEGGGDNDTAAWSTSPVGNADHTINLQHDHTVDSHSHLGPSHNHGAGTLQFEVCQNNGNNLEFFNSGGSASELFSGNGVSSGADSGVWRTYFSGVNPHYTRNGAGATGNSGTGSTGSASPGTDLQLSTTQSIQPRSVRVRFLIRTN